MSTSERVADALISRYNGKRTGNRIQSNSPYRADSDGLSFSLTISDPEHGAWKDFSADTGGSLYELAEHLGIDTPKRTPVESSLREYRGLADYAQSKGVPVDAFINAKWFETHYMNRPALQFPTAGGVRYRFLDGAKPKFISERGYTACLYGLKGAPKIADSSQLPLILTNGEPSVIVAQWYGLPAVCKTSGEARLPQALLDELISTWRGSFIIALDCDDTGRKASAQIATQLTDLGRVAVVVDLGLGDKGDLADFCRLHADGTLSAFTERVRLATPYVKPDATADKIADLAKSVSDLERAVKTKDVNTASLIDKTQSLLDGLTRDTVAPTVISSGDVLNNLMRMISDGFDGIKTGLIEIDKHLGGIPRGAPTVIYGATGMGKSTLTSSICSNWEVQGKRIVYVTTELLPHKYMVGVITAMTGIQNTAIFNNEIPANKYRAFTDACRLIEANGNKFVNSISPSPKQLKVSIYQAIEERNADAVVIDSATNLASAGEYSATYEMQSMILEVARETNLPFLVTSQIDRRIADRQDKTPKLNDARGGGMIEDNAHNVIGMYRHDYYVSRHLEDAKPEFPTNTVRAIYLKTRTAGVEGMYSTLAYYGGIGITNLSKGDDF